MLSFFLKKKQGPDTPHDEIIQGPDAAPNNGADDFIFIEKKINDDPRQPVYPPIPTAFPGPNYPMPPYPPQKFPATVNTNQNAVPYIQDVPFILAPQLRSKNSFDLTQTQVDGVLALLTRGISLDETEEYSFALERSIKNECY